MDFDFDDDKKEKDMADIDKEIDSLLAEKTIDSEFIKKHPPVKDYMSVELKSAEIETKTDENTAIKEKAMILPMDDNKLPEGTFELVDPKDKNKKYKVTIWDTVFRTDLRDLIKSQLYECPSTVFPTITERIVQTALNEKDAKYPEKRKDVKDWTWLIIIVMLPILIIVAISLFGGG